MLTWLRTNGAKFDNIRLRYYTDSYRGVHSIKEFKKGEDILYIPHALLVTKNVAL